MISACLRPSFCLQNLTVRLIFSRYQKQHYSGVHSSAPLHAAAVVRRLVSCAGGTPRVLRVAFFSSLGVFFFLRRLRTGVRLSPACFLSSMLSV